MTKHDEAIDLALRSPEPFEQLRSLVLRLFSEGESQEAVLARFEAARQGVSEVGRDEDENLLLDVLDCLVGWCAPHARLAPDRTGNS